jgi:hypothetical protein
MGGRFGFWAELSPQGPEGAPATAALPLIRSTNAVIIRFSSSVIVKSFSRHKWRLRIRARPAARAGIGPEVSGFQAAASGFMQLT